MRAGATIRLAMLCAAAVAFLHGHALRAQQAGEPVVLDSVVAVVNNHAILSSDVDNALRLSALDASEGDNSKPDRRSALDELISRALIEQQMTPEEKKAAAPTAKDLADRMALLRADLPACARFHCATDRGWGAFLAANGLTQSQAEAYLRMRLTLLAFIENRFSQGIRITQDEIDSYYRDSLTPQYPAGQKAPSLATVAPRIEEILLQEKVNQLFGAWLDNLRKQGDVEVLDPSLAPADKPEQAGGGR